MPVSAQSIAKRKAAYCCCYGQAYVKWVAASDTGRVGEAAKHWRTMLLLDWAIGVLNAYGEECKGQRNSTYDEVCCAMLLADPCCVNTGCQPTPTQPRPITNPPDVPPCQVLWQWEADEVVDELPEDPVPGRRYYVRTGNGDIFTFVDGGTGGFDYGFDFGLN